ncbi:integrase [Streptomyces sp. NPDC049949]|uniref:integrase n=1 Tax=Streptomyces sp. NPDC049949 TaxID=3154627 RepID=UPI003412C951
MQVTVASAKGDGAENEDGAFVALPGCVAVLDGLSAPKDLPMGCHHGTPWLVRQLGTRLVALGSNHDLPLVDVLRTAIEEVNGLHADTCKLDQDAVPAATVVMLRERPDALDYLVLSDSVLVLDTGSSIGALADSRVEDVAKSEMAAALAGPAGTPERTARVSELVARQRELRNRPGGYWVASTAPEAADHAITGSLRVGDLRRAALLTDGASRLVDVFHEATWEEVLDLLEQEGPSGLLTRVRTAESSDNDGTRWPRFKVRDDATAAYAVFGPDEASLC